MKRIYSFITSLSFMSFIFLAIGFSMAIATFIESSYGTPAARSLIYHAWWFELLWTLFAINLINNIVKYKLYVRQKWTLGLFHISFLLILIGAVITRFISYEGIMHIRENTATNNIVSSDDFFFAEFNGEKVRKNVIFSEITPKEFSTRFNSEKADFKVKSVGFIKNAERKIVPDSSGEAIIDLVFATPAQNGMQSYFFTKGTSFYLDGFSAGFDKSEESVISFFAMEDELYMVSKVNVQEMTMTSQETVEMNAGDTIPVKKMFLYSYGEIRFLVRDYYSKASFTTVKNQSDTGEDAVILQISDGINEKNVTVFGRSTIIGDTTRVNLKNGELKLSYGAIPKTVPFEIYLKDFQLEKYAGSNSPSSYASEVELRDASNGEMKDVRIFMNNTLNYKGFKFFQSSYDQDEMGTVLSVNYDFWGTNITYLGYILMTLGFILSMISKNSYFTSIVMRLKNSRITAVILLMILSGFNLQAQPKGYGAILPDINDEVVEEFSRLWVQGRDGRTEPISTLSSEVVRKISKKSSLYGKTTDEVMLSMMVWPEIWRTLPVLKVSSKEIASELGAEGDFVSLEQMFDDQGNYKIEEQVRMAYSKIAAFRNQKEKEYIYVDERVNISFMIFRGTFLNVFPSYDKEIPWYTPGTLVSGLEQGDSLFISSGFQLLTQSVIEQNNLQAVQILNAVDKFQLKFAEQLLPSERKKNTEILYNRINVFKSIFPVYLIFGFLLLLVFLLNVFREKPLHPFIEKTLGFIIFLVFALHTVGLIVRWYISGHAPWSNGFESVVYVAWAAMLAGFIFGRKYPIVIGTAAFLSGISLFVAHLSWMNPEVTNLVPVLKSYWLAIHVAIITASYGFIGLSSFLGIIVMILISFRNKDNAEKVTGFINQLTSINELSVMVGLYSLTVGTFLGGVWANESWGRYWGWDPKETWALITVVLYSFIAHMRLIPSLKGVYNYNMASVIGLVSVLMTYFGVNYFLAGLHSYGRGVASGIHWSVYGSFALIGLLLIFAWYKDNLFESTSSKSNSK